MPTATAVRLSSVQEGTLHAVYCGSKGEGANPRTLESLRKKGLIRGMEGHLGHGRMTWIWLSTPAGDAIAEAFSEGVR